MKRSEKAWSASVRGALAVCTVLGGMFAMNVPAWAATLPASDAPPLVSGWYLVSTPEQLAYIDQNQDPYVSGYLSGNIELMNNLNMSGYDWVPFGGGPSATNVDYSGTFNGNGYTVSDLSVVSGGLSVGFFGSTSGTIENLDVSGSVIETNSLSSVGGLVGLENGGHITNSAASGTVSMQVSGSANSLVGGLVGAQFGSIANSDANAMVIGGGGVYSAVGGLVGQQSGSITNSYAVGTSYGSSAVGGLVGSQKSGSIINSYATTAVSATGTDVGGLVGVQDGSILNSFFDSTTTGQTNGAGVTSGSGSATQESTNAMQTGTTFKNVGWDFAHTWGISPSVNGGFPYLLSNQNFLIGLTVSSGTLTTAFTPGTLNYTDNVANTVTSVTVTPTVADSTESVGVSVYGHDVTGSSSYTVPLQVGDNPVTITVTAQDGTSQTYNLTVNRASALSGDMPEVPFAGVLPGLGMAWLAGWAYKRRRKG